MRSDMIRLVIIATMLVCAAGSKAQAGFLTVFSATGQLALSTDGLGTTTGSGTLQSDVLPGSSIRNAYVFAQATFLQTWSVSPTITFNGTTLSNATLIDGGNTAMFDVTAIVQAGYNPVSNAQSWTMVENTNLEGSALAVVYTNASLVNGGVVLSAGGFSGNGNSFTMALPTAIGATGPVVLSVGIDFSSHGNSGGQYTTIDVNGSRLTSNASDFEDGQFANGALLTVGGVGDSIANPGNPNDILAPDDELYNLRPFVTTGATSIAYTFNNIDSSDRLFFLGLQYEASASGPPQATPLPPTLLAGFLGVAMLAGVRRFRRA